MKVCTMLVFISLLFSPAMGFASPCSEQESLEERLEEAGRSCWEKLQKANTAAQVVPTLASYEKELRELLPKMKQFTENNPNTSCSQDAKSSDSSPEKDWLMEITAGRVPFGQDPSVKAMLDRIRMTLAYGIVFK